MCSFWLCEFCVVIVNDLQGKSRQGMNISYELKKKSIWKNWIALHCFLNMEHVVNFKTVLESVDVSLLHFRIPHPPVLNLLTTVEVATVGHIISVLCTCLVTQRVKIIYRQFWDQNNQAKETTIHQIIEKLSGWTISGREISWDGAFYLVSKWVD